MTRVQNTPICNFAASGTSGSKSHQRKLREGNNLEKKLEVCYNTSNSGEMEDEFCFHIQYML